YEHFQGALLSHALPGGGEMKLPDGFSVHEYTENGRHFIDIVDDHKHLLPQFGQVTDIKHLEIGSDGRLTQDALLNLHEHNFEVNPTHGLGDVELSKATHTATIDDLRRIFTDLAQHK